jgi:hypothetical protein
LGEKQLWNRLIITSRYRSKPGVAGAESSTPQAGATGASRTQPQPPLQDLIRKTGRYSGPVPMTIARAHLIDPPVTRWYHCITRCVRRAFLLGEGPQDRKLWIENRLRELAKNIDLNPVAAGIAEVPEASEHTSIKMRESSPERGAPRGRPHSGTGAPRGWAHLLSRLGPTQD